MASIVPENLAGIKSDEFNKIEVSAIDADILMSLLEEPQVDNGDEERLRRVIQSLETEIDPTPTTMDGQGSLSQPKSDGCPEDWQLYDAARGDDGDCWTPNYVDFSWADMQMTASSPDIEMEEWYTNEMGGVIEFRDMAAYSYAYYYGSSLEELGYTSLWQQT